MRQPSCLQTNIRKPMNSEVPPKLCGSHGNGLPDAPPPAPPAPVVKSPQRHRGELLRSETRSKWTAPPPPVPPSEEEIRKVAEDAVAAYLKRWMGGK
jgi:hypothetical protein